MSYNTVGLECKGDCNKLFTRKYCKQCLIKSLLDVEGGVQSIENLILSEQKKLVELVRENNTRLK